MVKELLIKNVVVREKGYFYFIDGEGNLGRAKMQPRQKKNKEAAVVA